MKYLRGRARPIEGETETETETETEGDGETGKPGHLRALHEAGAS
jgi:hypothetical protein